MSSRLTKAAVVSVVVLVAAVAAAQLVRPSHTNPATDSTHTLRSQLGATSSVADVLDRSCADCHSNATEWRWYTQVAPLSWVMDRAVTLGRKTVNFSEWTAYPPAQRRALLVSSCLDATNGKMPMNAYLRFRPDAKLSARDVETICAASRQPEPNMAINR
jgi:hypothetical protein